MPAGPQASSKHHLLTVAVEDYFHVAALRGSVRPELWERFESRLAQNIDETLQLLAEHEARATFFVLGWTAERQPEIVRRIALAGHEIASRGYWPRTPADTDPRGFKDDLQRTQELLENAGSNPIVGYRCGHWIDKKDLWILDVLAEQGYLYDSSINPTRHFIELRRAPREASLHRHSRRDLSIWELPVSCIDVLGFPLAISGGNYLRQIPQPLLRRAVDHWDRHKESPLVFYFMPWELDPQQPHVTSISRLNRIRQYRNLGRTRVILDEYLRRYRFQAIGDFLGIPYRERCRPGEPTLARVPEVHAAPNEEAKPLAEVTLVLPLFNEEQNLSYLQRALLQLRHDLRSRYRLHLTLVDDGSVDQTWDRASELFASIEDCELVRHPQNRGVAAAILTGIEHAPTEIVCSLDGDLSYDPMILPEMIPLLEQADLVTASPYHPRGRVFNVPSWRLFLSRNLSRLYSLLLGEKLYTYTSCARVYRKSVFERIALRHPGFLGVAEMLLQLRLAGGRIVEHPAMLESRLFGVSKMKTLKTIGGHLGLLADLAMGRHARLTLEHTDT